jgi:CheY-like chemotaxis protein
MVCRILVADDSSTIQKVIKIGLAGIPNEIRAVGSLIEATKASDPGQLDLIIADAGLPGISTATDFVKLAETAGGLPIIVLMGSYDSVRESDLRAVGITNIVKKPFPPGDLAQLVQDIIWSKATQQGSFDQGAAQSRQGAPQPFSNVASGPAQSLAHAITQPFAHSIPQSIPMAGLPSFSLGDDPPLGSNLPAPEIEPGRKGRPAFDLGADSRFVESPFGGSDAGAQTSPTNPVAAGGARQPSPPVQSSGSQASGLSAAVEALVRNELPTLVDRAVERYCVEHFKSAAREALTAELRRLAEEKARYLVDQ